MMPDNHISKQIQEKCSKDIEETANWWIEFYGSNSKETCGFINNDNTKDRNSNIAVMLVLRILITYSDMARKTNRDIFLKAADSFYNYIIEYFYDDQNMGVYWELDRNLKVIDSSKKTIAQFTFIIALIRYYNCRKNDKVLNFTIMNFYHIEKETRMNKKSFFHLDAFERNWRRLNFMPIDKHIPKNVIVNVNSEMHMLAAATDLYKVTKSRRYLKKIKESISTFSNFFYVENKYSFGIHYNKNIDLEIPIYNFGQNAVCSFHIWEAINVVEDKYKHWTQRLPRIADNIIKNGMDNDGGIFGFYKTPEKPIDKGLWWVQFETMNLLAICYKITKNETYLKKLLKVYGYVELKLKDNKNGEFHWDEYQKNSPSMPKVNNWKGPMHVIRSLSSISETLGGV